MRRWAGQVARWRARAPRWWSPEEVALLEASSAALARRPGRPLSEVLGELLDAEEARSGVRGWPWTDAALRIALEVTEGRLRLDHRLP